MLDNLKIADIRILRYGVGVGVAVFLAAWLDWQLAFITPIFTAKFLIDKPTLSKGTFFELLLAMIATMGVGLLLSGGLTAYPIPMLLLIGLSMLWGYFLFTDPKWNLFATLLLIAVTLLPFMALVHPITPLVLASGLVTSGTVAAIIFALVHIYIPDHNAEITEYSPSPLTNEQRWHASFRALIIAMPAICFFYTLQISDAVLTMIFIALLSLMITSEKSIKISAFLIISNTIGGLLAIVSYTVLSIAPSLAFYVLFITLLALLIGHQIYTKPDKAPIYATAFSTLLVLIGSTLLSSGEIDSKTYTRVFQLFLVGTYMIIASLFLETRDWKFLFK